MIGGPALLIGGLLLAGALLYLLRRVEWLAALSAAVAAFLVAQAMWRLPLASPVRILGRAVLLGRALTWEDVTLQLTPSAAVLLTFLFGLGAITFILAWRSYQGRTFYPFGMGMLALWSMVALIQPLTYAPLVITLASVLAVFIIQAGRPGETRGAWRQLLFPALAVPLFLVANWYIDQAPLNPDNSAPLQIAGWLLIAGFVLLLQPAPLHVAIPSMAGQAPPIVVAFLWLGGQTVVLYLLQRYQVAYPWLGATLDSAQWLLWLGVLTAVLGGVLTSAQTRLGRLVGYAGVFDYGVLMVALGLRGTAGLPTTIWLLLTRTLALLTIALGAALIRHHMESDRLDRLRGAWSRMPWATAAFVAGGFGLVGMPLTAQFASRWALLQLLTERDPRWALLLIIGAAGVMVGVVRAGRACFGGLSGSRVEREAPLTAMLAAGLVLASLLLGLVPQLLTGPVAAVILPLSTLGP